MRVIVPYTHLAPGDAQALTGADVEFIDVTGSDTADFDLLAGLWADGHDFAIVEQDIVVRPDTLKSFDSCARDWCAAGYQYLGSASYAGLGCARFRAVLIGRYPDLMDDVALHHYEGHSPKHWCTLDAAVQRELWARGEQVCVGGHHPVGHLNPTPTHGCVPA